MHLSQDSRGISSAIMLKRENVLYFPGWRLLFILPKCPENKAQVGVYTSRQNILEYLPPKQISAKLELRSWEKPPPGLPQGLQCTCDKHKCSSETQFCISSPLRQCFFIQLIKYLRAILQEWKRKAYLLSFCIREKVKNTRKSRREASV